MTGDFKIKQETQKTLTLTKQVITAGAGQDATHMFSIPSAVIMMLPDLITTYPASINLVNQQQCSDVQSM